jgi:putative ABC transport system ATP-binding protein
LASDPDLILADEPTASLDAASGLEAIKLLRQLARQHGKTAVVVTHDPRILTFADRILHLESGVICGESAPDKHGAAPQETLNPSIG